MKSSRKKRGDAPERQSPTNYHSFQDQANTSASRMSRGARGTDSISRGRSPRPASRDPLQPPSEACDHRGFSTSIHDLYRDPAMERIDCCSMTCCGILQHDRDRYLIQGITPPSPFKRLVVHFLMPLSIFLLAGLVATHVRDKQTRLIACWCLVGMLIFYAAQQAFKWRSKTITVRKDLLWLKYQIQHHSSNNNPRAGGSNLLSLMEQHRPESLDDDEDEEAMQRYYLGQSTWDVSCAHPCCIVGCYRDDRQASSSSSSDSGNNASVCRCLWTSLCFSTCGLLFQCCGVCALAQEAREIETVLLPASYRRIDYITMQAMMDYYPAIYKARWHPDGTRCCGCSTPPLSRLSVRLLQGLAVMSILLLAWSIGGQYYWRYVVGRHNKVIQFDIYNFGVYVAAWAQSLSLLTLVVWFVNRHKKSELSTDAIIKYFAAGFCLSTSLAVFWEIVGSLVIKVFVTLVLLIAGVGEAASPEDGAMQLAPAWGFGAVLVPDDTLRLASSGVKDFVQAFGNDHPVFYTFYIFVTAFFLAAFIEEVCKYFGFRMVEHPDFLSSRDLDEANRIVLGENDNVDEEEADVDDEDRPRGDGKPNRPSYSKQGQSLEAKGNAITLAMVAAAIGFACCENMVYLFVYSNGSIATQLTVLISRSFFPVHPIAAALQSIGVCRRDLEGARNFQLGHIILPAVIFHGAYDFFILWIDFFSRRHGTYAKDDDGSTASDESSLAAVAVSFVISMLSIFLALYHLWSEGRRQRQRLVEMDRRDSVDRSSLI